LLQLAALGKSCDIDLLNYKTEDGRSIRAALDYLMPYADATKKWPHKQITPERPERLRDVIVQAATLFDDPGLFAIADKIEAADDWRVRLLYNR